MKHKAAVFCGLIFLLTGAMLVWHQEQPGGVQKTMSTGTNQDIDATIFATGHSEVSKRITVDRLAAHVEPTTRALDRAVDLYSIRERFNLNYDPMIIHALGEFSDVEIEAYNELHIIPFNRQVGEDCWQEDNEFLPGEFATVCIPIFESPPHTYKTLDLEALKDLAETDSAASISYADRTTDANERDKYHLRAAALSGKSGPLIALAEKDYRFYVMATKQEDGSYVESLLTENLVKRLALESIADEMGDPRARPSQQKKLIQQLMAQDSRKLINDANVLAALWIQDMKDVHQMYANSNQEYFFRQ